MNYEEVQWDARVASKADSTVAGLEAMYAIKNLLAAGEGKNLRFAPQENETLFFPPADKVMVDPRPFNGTTVLYVEAYSVLRDRFVWIPVAIFRRIPIAEDQDVFDPATNPLLVELAEARRDLDRIKILCNCQKVTCKHVETKRAAELEQTPDGKWRRVEGKTRPLSIYVMVKAN